MKQNICLPISRNHAQKRVPLRAGGQARARALARARGSYTGTTHQSRTTPPSLAVLTLNMHLTGRVALLVPPSSCSQNSTWRAVRACSQNAPVLPLKQHLLDHKTHLLAPEPAPDGLWALRAWSLTSLGASGGNVLLHAGENISVPHARDSFTVTLEERS